MQRGKGSLVTARRSPHDHFIGLAASTLLWAFPAPWRASSLGEGPRAACSELSCSLTASERFLGFLEVISCSVFGIEAVDFSCENLFL